MEIVLQDGVKDCGICCLLSIIKHYKGNISKEKLRELTLTDKNGVSAYNIIETAEKLGFSSSGVKGNIDELKNITLPIIAHVIINKKYQHFIVIYNIDYENKKVTIMDPAKGKKIISFSKFNLISSGVFILFDKISNIICISTESKIKTILMSFLAKNKKYIPFILVLTILINILTIITTYHFKYLQETAIEYNLVHNIILVSFLVFIICVLKEMCTYLKNIILIKFSTALDDEIMNNTFKQIVLLPYLYYKNRTSGEVLSRIRDLSIVKDFISKVISFLLSDLLFIIMFLILLYNINNILALITIITVFVIFIITKIFRIIITPYIKKYYKNIAIINSTLVEDISSPNVIKSMHLEKLMLDKFDIKYKKYLNSSYDLYKLEEIENIFKSIVFGLFNILIFSIGSKLVIEKKITLGELIIFQTLLNNLFFSYNNLLSIYIDYKSYTLAKNRIDDLFVVRKEVFDGAVYYQNCSLNGSIKFNKFTYSYNDKLLLENINITIRKGEKILLKGKSGSGKSTLVKSLMRYIDIPYGRLSINNIDINHYHLDTIRNNIIYVSNQEYLYTDTLLENIKVYKTYDNEKIEEVCKITRLSDVIKKDSLGVNQLIEENGYNLSAGEKQRIILARTLLKKRDIYIFDEAFSQIDINTCEKIIKDIFSLLKDKTVIVISHRLNASKLFNKSLILKDHMLYEEKV